VEVWNRWKAEVFVARPNLNDANYSNTELNYLDLSESDLIGANLRDRMPYFTVGGESIDDKLHRPKFHLLAFSDGQSDQ
jgi:hypothetical protein